VTDGGLFCVGSMCDRQTGDVFQTVVMLDWSEIMSGRNTAYAVVRCRRTK